MFSNKFENTFDSSLSISVNKDFELVDCVRGLMELLV